MLVELHMRLTVFPLGALQNCLALLAEAEADGIVDISAMRQALQQHIDSQLLSPTPRPAEKRRPDNLTACAVCGQPAVIVPLNINDGTRSAGGATHAVQCQNRPAADQPWQNSHCGHTEYIVRGDK
jgi:hypothetical protein